MDKSVRIIRSIILILILLLIFFYLDNMDNPKPLKKDINEDEIYFKIDFIDVGQADCILVSCNGKNMLVDAGNNEDGYKIVQYLQNQKIKEFDYIIATHAHEDHIGGIDNVMKNFSWKHLYMPSTVVDNMTYKDITNLLEKENRIFETPKIGDTFTLGNAMITVLSIKNDLENINDNSIVLRIVYKNTSYLLTGDATTSIEKELLEKEIQSDVLKVSHHGSYDANSSQFLYKVHPRYAIITAEKENEYGFPKEGVLNRLEKIGAIIYRTDLDGTIHLVSDGEAIQITTEHTDTNEIEKR